MSSKPAAVSPAAITHPMGHTAGPQPSPPQGTSLRAKNLCLNEAIAYLMHATGVMSSPLAEEPGCLQPPLHKNAGTKVNMSQTLLKYGDS